VLPAIKFIAPPASALEVDAVTPLERNTSPPDPKVPLPTVIDTLPLNSASPVKILTSPATLVAVPVDNRRIPDDPTATESPVTSETLPEVCCADFPVLSTMPPDDTLADAPAALATVIDPEARDCDPPLAMITLPPVCAPVSDAPADTTTAPPTPDVPLPTTTLIAPPRPPVEEPLSTDSQPLLPDFDAPLLNSTVPDEPDDATFAVDTDTLPLPLLKLAPLFT
jgi:hypothetical protein